MNTNMTAWSFKENKWIEVPEEKIERMTNREIAMFYAKGNGEVVDTIQNNKLINVSIALEYNIGDENRKVLPAVKIRTWGEKEWHEPLKVKEDEKMNTQKNEKKEHYTRIINKSKDGVILVDNRINKQVKASWEEFSKCYYIDPEKPYHAILKSEMKEKYDKIDEIFKPLTLLFIMSGGNNNNIDTKLKLFSVLGDSSEDNPFDKVSKLLDCTRLDAINMFREYLKMMCDSFLNLGVGFTKDNELTNVFNDKMKRKNKMNLHVIDKENKEEDYTKCSIGDIIKDKIKVS